MPLELGPHLDEAELESYSMQSLDEAKVPGFEEHLLACTECQDRLLEMDAYINAVRSVSPRLRAESESATSGEWLERFSGVFDRRRMIWAASSATLVLTAGLGWRLFSRPAVAVDLVASRGLAGPEPARAVARRPVLLRIDLSEMPVFSAYHLTLVDSTGQLRWQANDVAAIGSLSVEMPARLGAGDYFVRLYAPTGEMLREFSLRLD